MTMAPRLRKFALTAHITLAVGWIGAVAGYIALDVAAATSQDAQTLRAAYLAMELIVWYVIVPLALASLLTGLVMSLGTKWGLFRHYWVLISLLLTIIATVVLLVATQTISYFADIAADPTTTSDDLRALGSTLVHSVGGTMVLLVILVLNVYKPRGMTSYGWRKQREERMSKQRDAEQHSRPPAGDDALERCSMIAALAVAGIVGPVMFAVVALVQSLLRPEHSLVADPISALAAGPSGWVQNVNFLVFGALMIAYAIGLHLGVRPTRWAIVGLAFLVLSGVGLVWAGVFPSADAAGAKWDDRVLHIVAFPMTFLGAGIGLIVMSRRMAGDPRWRSFATYALATGIAVLVLLLAGAGLVRPPGAPLHPWWGLFQWVLLAVWFPCMVVLALRLLRVARAADAPR
jgi:hypothetical membrane protein